MLLTLGTHAGFTRRTLSPKGEDLLQLRRLRFLSGCVPERSMSPVRNLSSNIATTGSSLKVKGSTLNSLVPESPNLFSLELPDLAQPPEPPDPPDAPSELQDVPSSTTPAPVSLDMTYPSSPPISTDLCSTRARTFPSRSVSGPSWMSVDVLLGIVGDVAEIQVDVLDFLILRILCERRRTPNPLREAEDSQGSSFRREISR